MVSRERRHRSNSWTDCSLSHSSISPRTRRRPMWDHLHATSYSHASRSVAGQEKWEWEWRWKKKGPGRGLCRRRGGTSNCSLPKPSVRYTQREIHNIKKKRKDALYTSTYRLHCLPQTTFPPFPPPRLASPSFPSLSSRRLLFPYRPVAQRR